MHEAGLLAAAVESALAAGGPARSTGPGSSGARGPVAVEITVHDPMHISPESALLHAELALRARGLAHVVVRVTADPVACSVCEASNEVSAADPFCSECGFPLPDRGGHAVQAVAIWADEVRA